MKKRFSISYFLIHVLLFIFVGLIVFSGFSIYQFSNHYPLHQKEYIDSSQFYQSYMKYIERLTFYIHYTDSGFRLDLSSPANLSEIIQPVDNNSITDMNQYFDQNELENYEFYNTLLNVESTNFLYYVENTTTGEIFSSPYLKILYPSDISEFTKDIQNNPAFFILNTKTGKYTTNVNQNSGILTKSDLNWMISTLSEPCLNENSKQCNYIIYTGVVPQFTNTDDVFYSANKAFEESYGLYEISLLLFPISAIIALLFTILLLSKTGKPLKNSAEYSVTNGIRLNHFDMIPTEFAAILIIAGLVLEIMFIRFVIRDILNHSVETRVILQASYCILYPMAMSGLLSLVRRMKSRTLITNSLLYRIFLWLRQRGSQFFEHQHLTYRTVAFLFVFIALQLIGVLFYFKWDYELLCVLCIVTSYIYLFIVLMKISIDLGIILERAKKMQEGDIDLTLPVEKMSAPIRDLGDYINNISAGLSVAVEERTKSERFKAELITNVSHDIKTPLTSIINYIDLLKKESIDSEKANEYLTILTAKSWRLKTLIEDLVEASKASSGAIKMNLEKINLIELLKQAAGEFDDRFREKHLELLLDFTSESISIYADGRSTYRIIDNLFSNLNKYALQGTRVYVDVYTEQNNAVLTIKNISKERLNISSTELMKRFVRGDSSRNTEGSGLGLSISRSLTTLQNGTFDIEVDGDLFKVVITLPLSFN